MMDLVLEKKTKTITRKQKTYEVWGINDDTTPMDVVILILNKVFGLSPKESIEKTVLIDSTGEQLIKAYKSKDIALMKANQGMSMSEEIMKLALNKPSELKFAIKETEE